MAPDSKQTTKPPPHPLTGDKETGLFRYVTHEDVRRWEIMEIRYTNLIARLRNEVNDAIQ